MHNAPSDSDHLQGLSTRAHQPDQSTSSDLIDQVSTSEARPSFFTTDDDYGHRPIFSDLDVPPAYDPSQPAGANPFYYESTPPLPPLVLPDTFPPGPGLVRMLATYPGNLPSTADVPVALTTRLATEVVDHLDSMRLVEVPFADVTEEWLSSFKVYLEAFYGPERVTCYLGTIRLLVARYSGSAEPDCC